MDRDKKKGIRGFKRWVLYGVLFLFGFQLVLPAAIVPLQAQALFGLPEFSITLGDIPAWIRDAIAKALKTAADIAFKNVLKNYMNALAYNYAVKIATGESGQKPYFVGDPLQMLQDAGDAAAGDFLDSITSSWIGKSKCDGHSYESCATDRQCPPVIMACPETVTLDCSGSPENKRKCLASGCYTIMMETEEETTLQPKLEQPKDPQAPRYVLRDGARECISSFSLCDLAPGELNLPLKMQLSIMAREATFEYDRGTDYTGECPISEIVDNFYEYREMAQKNYNQIASRLGADSGQLFNVDPGTAYLVEFSKKFNPKATQLGAYLKIKGQAELESAVNEKATAFAQGLAGELKPVTSKITGVVKTPATFLSGAATSLLGNSVQPYMTYTGTIVADAVGLFTNTLANKLIEKWLFQGVSDERTVRSFGAGSSLSSAATSSAGVSAARVRLAELKKTEYSVGGELNIVSKLSSCPDTENPTPDTCVIDSRFATAINQKMTVQEALDEGLLDGNKILGFDSSGNEPEYYNGYPYRSLVILRKYRILPVGWELAAEYIREYARGNYSLNTIIADYYNQDSPFYQLIDPNWVLKAPELYCKRQGAGEKISYQTPIRGEDTNKDQQVDTLDAANILIQRQDDYCADEQQCLSENEDGSCKKYGYCMEERPVWRFDANKCNAEYTSCETLQSRGGDVASYLLDTVDYNGCSVDNAGCQWYCTGYNEVDNYWVCDGRKPLNAGWDVISLNANASECSASSEGCTEFMKARDNGTNLKLNSGFDDFFDGNNPAEWDGVIDSNIPDYFNEWTNITPSDNCGLLGYAVSDAFSDQTAVRLSTTDNANNPLPDCGWPATGALSGGNMMAWYWDVYGDIASTMMTVSFYAKTAEDDPDCSVDPGTIDAYGAQLYGIGLEENEAEFIKALSITPSSSWTRYTGTIRWKKEFPVYASDFLKSLAVVALDRPQGNLCDVVVDDVKVEWGALTDYSSYEEADRSYYKDVPSWFNECGLVNRDNPECEKYVQYCRRQDVGCDLYTPTSGNPTPVSGIITPAENCINGDPDSCNQCPAEYVGCQAFREQSIDHVPLRPQRDPVSFVPNTGLACPASQVGCEEYTNIETVAEGGEGLEYYAKIKMCVDEGDAEVEPYYTWEGSDEFGYQLRKYELKRSNVDDGPCTNMGAEDDPILEPLGLDWPACIDDEDVDGDGIIDYPHATCTAADIPDNPDCTEFFDAQGETFYVLRSRIIYESDQCISYKNTIDSNATCDAGVCSNNGFACGVDDDCRGHIYHMIRDQGVQCSEQYAGCRAYKGNAGDNVRTIYQEDFEGGNMAPWTGNVTLSNASLVEDGHSMRIANNAAINNVTDEFGLEAGRSYTLSFWAASALSVTAPITVALNSTPPLQFTGTAFAEKEFGGYQWNEFTVGPLYIPATVDISGAQLVMYSDTPFFVDNIFLTEVSDEVYYVQDTYTDCSGYEGCREYQDRRGVTHYLKSFLRLCEERVIGCDHFFKTYDTYPRGLTSYEIARYKRGDLNDDGKINEIDLGLFDALNWGTPNPEDYFFPPDIPWDVVDMNQDGWDCDGATLTCPNGVTACPNNEDIECFDATDRALLEDYIAGAWEPADKIIPVEKNTSPDRWNYYFVDDSEKVCSVGSKGCTRLGLPEMNPQNELDSFEDVYLINNPDDYGSTLCLWGESGCEEYVSDDGGAYYFKDPGRRTCEFKRVPGQQLHGWYQNGTSSGSPDCPVSIGECYGGGSDDGKPCNSSDDCASNFCLRDSRLTSKPVDGWVGVCPDSAAGCTEYRDPEGLVAGAEVISENYIINGGFENIVTPTPAQIAGNFVDGIVDTDTCDAGFCAVSGKACVVDDDCLIPDLFTDWSQNTTLAGYCDPAAARFTHACNTDVECGECGITPSPPGSTTNTLLCDADAQCTEPADLCSFNGNGCQFNADGTRVPCGDRLIATSDAHEGGTAAIFRSNLSCGVNPYDDWAHYSWKTIDTGSITDNKAFKVSFWAKRNPLDPNCGVPVPKDTVSFGLTRQIDDTPGDSYVQYLASAGWDIGDEWEYHENVFLVESAPVWDAVNGIWRDWTAVTQPLEEMQSRISMVIRRPPPATNPSDVCDLILDDIRLEEINSESVFSSYYYIDDTVEKEECNGIVSRDEGCRLFEDTSIEDLQYSSADSENLEPPALCDGAPDTCDSNSVIKVRPDRACNKWLECETSVRQEDANGNFQEMCVSRYICNGMDEDTGECISSVDYDAVDQTFTTPSFANKLRRYTGMVLAGLDWQRRCQNNPNIICQIDADCGVGGICDDPQVVEGALLYPAMREIGSVTGGIDLVKDGDFGDRKYIENQKLTFQLSGGDPNNPGDLIDPPPTEIDLTEYFSTDWQSRNYQDGTADLQWTEEDSNTGFIPSPNGNLDENNVAHVTTSGFQNTDVDGDGTIESAQLAGLYYDLERTVVDGEQYVLSFRMRWGGLPTEYDLMRIELGYIDSSGNESQTSTNIFDEIQPSDQWQEYVLGPVTAGLDSAGNPVLDWESTHINFVHNYTEPQVCNLSPTIPCNDDTPCDAAVPGDVCNLVNVPSVEFFLDDVHLRPALQYKEDGSLLNRTCRLYPSADAPYCSYVDENNVVYEGWEGYCLETDPNNDNYCINWLPVDVLKGGSSSFSTLNAGGYAGRRPLYMCTETRGNYRTDVFDGDQVSTGDFGGEDCASGERDSLLLGQEYGYRWAFDTRFIGNRKGNSNCDEAGDMENMASCRGGTYDGMCGYCDGDNCGVIESGGASRTWSITDAEDRRYRWEIERIALYGQRWSHNDWDAAGGSSVYADGTAAPKGCNPDGCTYFFLDENSSNRNWCGANCWCASWSRLDNVLTMSVCFDANEQLDSVSVYAWDGNNGGGFAALPVMYLREACMEVTQVVTDDDDKAWASRVERSSAYAVPDLQYTVSQFYEPMGGIITPATAPNTPTDWRWSNSSGPLYSELRDGDFAHAGSPYAFTLPYASEGRQCSAIITGDGYATLNECRNQNDVEKCHLGEDEIANTDDDGYCTGTGQGFCRADSSRYCTIANQEDDCDGLSDTTCIEGGGGASGVNTLADGVDHMKKVFARPFGMWRWNLGTRRYADDMAGGSEYENWLTEYGQMPLCNYDPNIGRAERPLYNPATPDEEYCGVPPVIKNILVGAGGLPERTDNVSISSGGVIQLTFDIEADPNQLPITDIEVDWGDNSANYITTGRFDSGSLFLSHQYQQLGSHVPSVRVIDNWDWCGVPEDAGSSCPDSTGDCRFLADGDDCEVGTQGFISTGITVNVNP